MKTGKILLILLIISVTLPWYSRINAEDEFYKKEKIDIPFSVVIKEIKYFKENREYYKKRTIRGVKSRTFIPYVYRYDTLTVSPFMYYSKEIE